MKFPRLEPVVSVALGVGMGHKVVVAGGGPGVMGGNSAVEVFDSEIGTWESYGDLPEEFSGYDHFFEMSGVVCDNKFYVSLLRRSEIGDLQIHVLDFYTKQWASIQLERPTDLKNSRIMAIGTTLVVAGVCADSTDGHFAVKLWKVDLKTLSLIQIGLMPSKMAALLGREPNNVPCLWYVVDENLLYIVVNNWWLIVADVSLEACKTYWHLLPEITLGVNFSVKRFSTFCASISSA